MLGGLRRRCRSSSRHQLGREHPAQMGITFPLLLLQLGHGRTGSEHEGTEHRLRIGLQAQVGRAGPWPG